MLELDRVTYGWDADAPVLDALSLTVHEGDRLVVLGANGCGKSTLLKLMNGLVDAQAGTVRFRGQPVGRAALAASRDAARRFRQACALLFQHPEAMLFNPTVRDEIAYGPRQLGRPDADACAVRWAAALGLASRLEQPPFLLSGGEKQKLALACVLAVEARLLLLDEPSSNLDPATVGWLIDTLLDGERTVVACTHNLSLAAELGTRCVVLGARGRVLYDGPVAAALRDVDLLAAAGLAHRHRHRHGGNAAGAHEHTHLHAHDWDAGG